MVDAQTILTFWFNELTPADWWRKSAQQDQNIRQRFLQVHADAHTGGLSSWRNTPNGRLSEIIVLDQFSRNIYRDDPRAFASDPLALELAQKTVKLGEDASLTPAEKSFMYLPYMHSESLDIHNQALHLFDQPGLENNLDFELKHKAIIDRFGRYPHRNKILGRTSTQQEIEFLDQPGSSF
ncbi:MAG: DUF924 domain-containing protein [Proteobacteria bacterium]|nr:DUF924 domain-containing protein [Pseudomonadota bacterium]